MLLILFPLWEIFGAKVSLSRTLDQYKWRPAEWLEG